MANDFNKEERLAWEQILAGFNDELVISGIVNKYSMGDQLAENASNVIWRQVPPISESYSGIDQSANFGDSVDLSVPSQIGTIRSANFTLNAVELRDSLAENRQVQSKYQKLASDVNVALMDTAANEGSEVVKIAAAASGFDDISLIDAALNETGVMMNDRKLLLSSRDYNKMASNLAARETINDIPTRALRDAYIGRYAGIDTYKLDYANSLTAAAGTTVTINGANQHYTPASTQASGNGFNETNIDNRYQTIAITVGGGTVKVGDCFTIAGVNKVHKITKRDTLQPKTFRIHEIVTGAGGTGTVKISPPIITTDVTTTAADKKYQNCSATPANGAAITFLNTVDAYANPFWRKDAIELLPSRLVVPQNSGMASLTGTTDQGLSLTMTRQGTINDLSVKYRFDVYFGTVMTDPEQAGIILFGQT